MPIVSEKIDVIFLLVKWIIFNIKATYKKLL